MIERTACRKAAGAALVSAASVFIITNAYALAEYRNFNLYTGHFSDFGTFPQTAVIWNAGMFTFGLLITAGALLLLYYRVKAKDAIIISALSASGTGFMILSAFNETIPGSLHSFGAGLGFIAGGLFTMASFNLVKAPISYAAAALGLISIISTVIFAIPAMGLSTGLTEAFITIPVILWLFIFGALLES